MGYGNDYAYYIGADVLEAHHYDEWTEGVGDLRRFNLYLERCLNNDKPKVYNKRITIEVPDFCNIEE